MGTWVTVGRNKHTRREITIGVATGALKTYESCAMDHSEPHDAPGGMFKAASVKLAARPVHKARIGRPCAL
jgi:hypothetical protein